MTTDDALRRAIREGCTALTLWPVGSGWQANLRNPDGGWRCVTDRDPVAAVRAVLRAEPGPTPPAADIFG
jgi:hypothetical protein